MGFTVIAPVGDKTQALFIGMKEFPTERVYLVTPSERLDDARQLVKQLDNFTIKSKIVEMGPNLLEEMFKAFATICSVHEHDDLIVNVATGDRLSTCAALSAAYANGLKAFGVMGDRTMILPIMKLSYYQELSENKMRILHALDATEYKSLKNVSQDLKMSLSLLSYHVNGNYKHKGLKEYRLIDIRDKNKSVLIRLSQMGKLLLKGYLPSC
jgi:DNA-binding transcriptional ArsR family regulator